jgi:hypothetical protein
VRKILYAMLLILTGILAASYFLFYFKPAPKTEIATAPTEVAPPGDTGQPPAEPAPTRPPNSPLFEGLLYAFVLPITLIGLPWILLQLLVIRYVQPRGLDLSRVRIKAKDGLFIETALSMTARRTLTLASTRMTWDRVRSFVEKNLEQELLHEALQYNALEELERNFKTITEEFLNLPIVRELSNDFGLDVVRFNIETRYPQETMDALNRKAEAAAGGSAYLAYAAAANLHPDSPECRQLYKIFQETSGQVDAARNLGGGISNLVSTLSRRRQEDVEKDRAD